MSNEKTNIMYLKCQPPYFQDLEDGRKTFDIRGKDREFHVGQVLLMREWDPKTRDYTGRVSPYRVVYVVNGHDLEEFGIKLEGWALGLKRIQTTTDQQRYGTHQIPLDPPEKPRSKVMKGYVE